MTPGNGQMDCSPGLDSNQYFAESGVCDLSVTRDQSYGNAQSPGLVCSSKNILLETFLNLN